MLMAATSSNASALDLFRLAVEMAANKRVGATPAIAAYFDALVERAMSVSQDPVASGGPLAPDVVELALAVLSRPMVADALRSVKNYDTLTEELARQIKVGIETEIAA